MTQSEYDKAKQECKKDLRNKLMLGNLQGDLFSATFDRAYALGKQQKTIAQEDIEKAAEAFATPPIGNGGMFTREQVKELLVRFAQLLLSKQEKDAEATSAASPKTTPASSAGTATNSAKNEKRNTAEPSILQ